MILICNISRMTTHPATIVPVLPTASVTHEVTNQAPRLVDYDASADPALLEGLVREGGEWGIEEVRQVGLRAGSAEVQGWADTANRYLPELRTHDRLGNRIDEVEYHPAYHNLLAEAFSRGVGATAWSNDAPGTHVTYYAKHLAWGQTDQGHMCPTSMTYAAVPALREEPQLAELYEPLLVSTGYDPGLRPTGAKASMTAGMSMTEKQGGSDLRTNTTVAVPTDEDGTYRLTGHKWFTSAPMSDVFLALAQSTEGPTCFLVPRVLPDGTRNSMRIQRLKDKLGNRSNAASEPEFDGAIAWRVGDEGRGIPTILKMVVATRMAVISLSSSQMRVGLLHAHHHVSHRRAFGKALIDQPLMRNVLADLALESEAATTLTMRLAGAFDRSLQGDEHERAFTRIATAIGKYWVAKRTAPFAAEALECLGGNGFVEESIMPRIYREAPLNTIWEGASNVNALDVLRAVARDPESIDALNDEFALTHGVDRALDAVTARIADALANPDDTETRARRIVEDMGIALQASLLLRYSPNTTAEAFVDSRLGGDWGHAFGTLRAGINFDAILDRAIPNP